MATSRAPKARQKLAHSRQAGRSGEAASRMGRYANQGTQALAGRRIPSRLYNSWDSRRTNAALGVEQFTQLLYCRQFLAQSILGFRQQPVFFALIVPVFAATLSIFEKLVHLILQGDELSVGVAEELQRLQIHLDSLRISCPRSVSSHAQDKVLGVAGRLVVKVGELVCEHRQARMFRHSRRCLADLLHGGKEQPDQDCDDSDHHQKFDQSESSTAGCRRWLRLVCLLGSAGNWGFGEERTRVG